MHIVVLTPEKEVFSGDISAVKVPGVTGQFEILKGHAAIVAALGNGEIRITPTSGSVQTFKIEQGFVEVLHDEVSLLVQGLEQPAANS